MFPPTNECPGFCVPLTCFPFNDVMLAQNSFVFFNFLFSLRFLHVDITYRKQQTWQPAKDLNTYRTLEPSASSDKQGRIKTRQEN